jgi:2-keto-3-deoxy-L-rhamnonate aldolase RhmA
MTKDDCSRPEKSGTWTDVEPCPPPLDTIGAAPVRPNRLRELLDSGEPTIGTHLFLCDPVVVEMIGHTGAFDYVEFLAEYAAYDLTGLDNFCRATELCGLGSMIKVDHENHRFVAQRAVGAGFESVLFADARSAVDIRGFVETLRAETPEYGGRFGVGARRHALPAYGGTPAYVAALERVVLAVMIEKKSAVEAIDEIVELERIDLIQWGPADYAMSIGRPGETSHPEVLAAERHVITTAHAAGVPCRAELATVEAADRYLELGVRHFSIGYDLYTIYEASKTAGERLRNLAGIVR